MRHRFDYFVLSIAGLILAASCGGGGGCGGCGTETIPGGFQAAKRNPNAAQLRVSQSGLAAIESNPAALVSALGVGGAGSGTIDFTVPASCDGNTNVCCPNNTPVANCGPIDIDLNLHPGDDPRLVLTPTAGQSKLGVTLRARIKTLTDIPVTVPIAGDCGIAIDTAPGADPDIQIDVPITFTQDATASTTRVNVGTVAITRLTSDDVTLTGGGLCAIANLGTSFFLGTLTSTLTGQIQSTIQDQTCKQCPGGTLDECGQFATACTNGVCEEADGSCLQELGLDGRMRGSSLFASLSPGTTGALDLYEVAGGYATTDQNGVALGLLGGMEPGGAPRDRCGPPATEPTAPGIGESAFFQGNTRPDTGAPYDVAIGVHESQLAQFAFAGYDGGLLCLTVGHDTVSQLSTDTIGLLASSLQHLVEGPSPVAVGLRPQSPPTITLGTNTFDGSGAITDPLLDLKFTGMELDFFASVDDHYIRVFTVVTDVHLPIGLQVTAQGTLTPVIGSPTDAFTNVTVKNTDAVIESPEDLAAVFPQLLGLVVPQLSGGLGSISLPQLGGLTLNVTDITAVDNKAFLAIFANLAVPTFNKAVKTQATVVGVSEPSDEIMRSPRRWKDAAAPSAELELGAAGADGELEYQVRLDGGFWHPWSRDAHPRLAPGTFWLPGVHTVQVRARVVGRPETTDFEGVTLQVPIGDAPESVALRNGKAGFHGTGNGQGCACDGAGAPASGGIVLLLLIGGVLATPRRWWRRGSKLVAAAAIAMLPGCDCGSKASCGDVACIDGDIPHGAVGRWTSIAGDSDRVVVATYDQDLGDVVAVDVTDVTKPVFTAVDGIPGDVTPTHDPSSYRGGVEPAGPDVGAWTSIAISNKIAKVAYQDRDAGTLKYAQETSTGGGWAAFVVDAGNGERVGDYASMTIDGDGHPAIAYLGVGVDDGMGHRVTELRLARASSSEPKSEADFTISTIASGNGSCAGLCGSESCIAATDGSQTCITASSDCSAACGDGQVCSSGACVDEIPDPTVVEPPGAQSTGLYVSLVTLPDGRLAAAYHDNARRALVLAVESGAGTSEFAETVLDQGANVDTGYWASAAVASDGTVHVAYQDALADEVMYTTWKDAPGTPQVVDDGERSGDRTHPVGASATIFLVNDQPEVVYQDGLDADVYLATLSGGAWSPSGFAMGPTLDGFWLAATTGHGGTPFIAWESLTPSASPIGDLVVQKP